MGYLVYVVENVNNCFVAVLCSLFFINFLSCITLTYKRFEVMDPVRGRFIISGIPGIRRRKCKQLFCCSTLQSFFINFLSCITLTYKRFEVMDPVRGRFTISGIFRGCL